MKSLALVNGDLSVGPQGYKTVTGASRIRQDLALALGEILKSDRFHPEWGSVLVNFIGQPIDTSLEFQIKAEVARVLKEYIAIQNKNIIRTGLNRSRQVVDTGDIVKSVQDITVKVSYDTIYVMASLLTYSGTNIAISRTVTL
jgi:hypothetical protein